MYIYYDHRGGLFASDEKLTEEELYCEDCNDVDIYLGYAKTKEDAMQVLKNGFFTLPGDSDKDAYIKEFLKKWD